MALFGPMRSMWELIAKATEGADSFMEIVSSKGLTGLVRSLLDFTPEGLKGTVDDELGNGIIVLLAAGDMDGVKTTMKFRDVCIDYLSGMGILADIIIKFNSDNLELTQEAVREMNIYMARQRSARDRTRREREMESELKRLRQTVEEIGALTEQTEKPTI